MSTEPPKPPESPWSLNGSRVVLLILGALLLAYVVAALSGSLSNYQQVKEGAQDLKVQQQTSAAPAAPSPAN